MKEKVYSNIKSIMESIGVGVNEIILICGGLIVFLLIMLIVVLIKQSILNKKYKQFMAGSDGKSLEEEIRSKIGLMDKLNEKVNQVANQNNIIDTRLNEVFQKVGIIKYDAFSEMGGKMSFALALLTDNNSGFVFNAMHSREGCYTYIKEIEDGKSKVTLAKEEKEALDIALQSEI